jgi:galactonate dehydratase
VDPSVFDFVDGHAVRRAAEVGHTWRNPVWRHQDGGHAEW